MSGVVNVGGGESRGGECRTISQDTGTWAEIKGAAEMINTSC